MTRTLLLLLATVLAANWDCLCGQSLFNPNTLQIEGWEGMALTTEDDFTLRTYSWDEINDEWSPGTWIDLFSEDADSGKNLHIEEYASYGLGYKYVFYNFRSPPEEYACGEWNLPHRCDFMIYPVADSIRFNGFDLLGNPYETMSIISIGDNGLVDTLKKYIVEDSGLIQRGFEIFEYDEQDRLIYASDNTLVHYTQYYMKYDSLGNLIENKKVRSTEGGVIGVDVDEYHFNREGMLEYHLNKYYSDSLVSLVSVDSVPVEFVGEHVTFSAIYRYQHTPYPWMERMEWTIVDNDTSTFTFRNSGPPADLRWFDVTERRFDEDGQQVASWVQLNMPGEPFTNSSLTLRDDGSDRYLPEHFITRNVDNPEFDLPTEVKNNYSVENFWWDRWAGESGGWQFESRRVTAPDKDDPSKLVTTTYSGEEIVSRGIIYGYNIPEDLSECAILSSDDCPYTSYPNSSVQYFKYPFFDSVIVTHWEPISGLTYSSAHFVETNSDGLVSKIMECVDNSQGGRSCLSEHQLYYDHQDRIVRHYHKYHVSQIASETEWEYDNDGKLLSETEINYILNSMTGATVQEFFYDERGLRDYALIKEYGESFQTPLSIDSVKYLYFSNDIVLERHYSKATDIGEVLVYYEFLRMKDGSTSMKWGYQLNTAFNHITNFELQSVDDEGRHTSKWTMGFDILDGILKPKDMSLYDYDLTVKTDETEDPGTPIDYTITGNELVVMLDQQQIGYVALYNASGQLIKLKPIRSTRVKIDTGYLLTGIYYLNVVEENRSRSAAIFIKGQSQ